MKAAKMKFKVTNEIEGVACVVCVLASAATLFTDNVIGQCSECGRDVQHRPHIPQPSTLLCWECYVKKASPDDEVLVTPRTLVEAQLAFRRN